jgi:molybdopterin/thiamine biosynthesis adenylyltransferase
VRVLLVGAGGLGSPVALALAAAPGARLSRITVLDPDRVELSNLHRQLLHGEGDLGRLKVDSAAARLRRPGLEIRALPERLEARSAPALFAEHDLVIEGSDDLVTKFLVNDEAIGAGVPALIGGVVQWSGQVLCVHPGRPAACYRCLFEEPPGEEADVPTCQRAGVLGPACGVVGGLMATEALRILRGEPPRHAGALLSMDLLSWRIRRVAPRPRPGCAACRRRGKSPAGPAPPSAV